MKKYFSLIFLFFSFSIAVFSVLFVRIVPEYNLDISENIIAKNSENFFEFSDSNAKNTWYIGIDKNKIDEQFSYASNFCIQFFLDWKTYKECLDVEHHDETEEYYTFPVITPLSKKISFKIFYNHENVWDIQSVKLYSQNTLATGKKLAFVMNGAFANSAVISRADWGADESLRYASHPRQMALSQKRALQNDKPKTEAELRAIKKAADINAFVGAKLASEFPTTELIRTENWQELVWPIQKVKKVNKIVIHHTADTLDGRSDEELLRAIYSYHAVTRGWGDIGYNFIVGQNGQIYEGRAGGDYVVAAHASYNNIGSVGISVLGDYEKSHLNYNQQLGLKTAITMARDKYGIDLNANVMGFRPCRNNHCYPIEMVYTKALLGHKDVGITNCPGKNIYNSLSSWRSELGRNSVPVLNPINGIIEPKIQKNSISSSASISTQKIENSKQKISVQPVVEPILQPTLQISSSTAPLQALSPNISEKTEVKGDVIIAEKNLQKPQILENFSHNITPSMRSAISERYFWKKFRVKLSYPDDLQNITLSAFGNIDSIAFFDYIRTPIPSGKDIMITPLGSNKIGVIIDGKTHELKNFSLSSGVIEIKSWNRIPLWDKKNQYNDNLFRDTIEVFNDNWKLVVVNHLPLEYYLKGLGEVSNTDLPEKIKTITVAARWYATFYMQNENRKYHTDRYDGSDDPDSFQKYLGFSYEMRSPNVAKMVDATEWEIIYFENKIIKPWYFSRSDGRTLSFLEYCQKNSQKNCENISYLQSVTDPAGIGGIRSGHGVGISGIGATEFARQGWDYKKIISYYLSGVEIRK